MIAIKDFKKYPSCCMQCPNTVIANNGKRYCMVLDTYIPNDKKRMANCPFENKETGNHRGVR
jgi:hypothetical protein